mgnify:CR=1 FL=1
MVPNLERTATLDFADDSVRCADAMMRSLKNRRYTIRNRYGEDEQVSVPEFESRIKLGNSRNFRLEPAL